MRSKPYWADVVLWRVVQFACFFTFIGGVGVLAWQGMLWLKRGFWTKSELQDLWERRPLDLKTDWVGFLSILDWVITSPLSGVAVIVSLAVMFWGIAGEES